MMDASPFTYMARTLAGRQERAAPAAQADDGATRTDRIRARLAQGPAQARELALVADVPSARVGALLKADLANGRVLRQRGADGAVEYVLNPDWGNTLEGRLQAALAFLRAEGWRCTPPPQA